MALLISIPVSLLLFWLILGWKKRDPFPKGGLLRLLVFGALSCVAAAFLYQILSFLLAAVRIGPGRLVQIFRLLQTDPSQAQEEMSSISASLGTPSPLRTLFTTLVTAGLLEELCKFSAYRISIRKEGMVRTWMDSVTCCATVGLTFQFLENLLYASQNGIMTAVLRSFVPVHFCCAVIMGYDYGRYLVTGKNRYRVSSVFVPVLIHTLFDTALNLLPDSSGEAEGSAVFEILALAALLAAAILTAVLIIRVVRWQRKGMLDMPVGQVQEG